MAHLRLLSVRQFESIIKPQKKGDKDKFYVVVTKLGLDALQQVTDFLSKTLAEDTYVQRYVNKIYFFKY